MSIEEICKIANIETNSENIEIITKFKPHIEKWLQSDEFKENFSKKPYPPLLNPNNIDYKNSQALNCWVLNLPLPKYYDFVIFGAHCCGFHAAIPGFLLLCGAQGRSMVIREGDVNKNYKENYIRMFNELCRFQTLKEKGLIEKTYLQITDLIVEKDCVKFHKLIDASKALHVVKDPIEIMRSATETQIKIENIVIKNRNYPLGLFLDTNYDEFLNDLLYYHSSEKAEQKLKLPDIKSIKYGLCDISQHFHSALLFELLKDSLKVVKLKQTSDFIGEKAFDTMKEISEHFGLRGPKNEDKWLFERRVADFKQLLPLSIYANDEMEVFDGKNKRAFYSDLHSFYFKNTSINDVENSVKLKLFTRFALQNITHKENDISNLFELADPEMRVFIQNPNEALKLLKNPKLLVKCQKYIKNLTQAIVKQAQNLKKHKNKNEIALEYLKSDPQTSAILKHICEQDLRVLKQVKPEIIDNWQTYTAFLKNCENIIDFKDLNLKEVPFSALNTKAQLKYLDKR